MDHSDLPTSGKISSNHKRVTPDSDPPKGKRKKKRKKLQTMMNNSRY